MATARNITDSDDISSMENSGASGSGQPGGAWNKVVRAVSEPIASVSTSSPRQSTAVIEPVTAEAEEESGAECGIGNAGSKRQAWSKQPSNGTTEVGPVMGAHSWPALSETTRGSSSTKSSSDSLKGLADGSSSSSSSVPQGTGTANSPSQKQVNNNGNSTSNHTAPTRQRSMKRSNSYSSANTGIPQPPASQGPVVEGHSNNPFPRDHTQKGGLGSQSYGGNDHRHPRGSFKHRNGNSHLRGDGSHHHNYGGRRDQDFGNQEWNSNRTYNGRAAHMQPQHFQRFVRHPPPPPPPPHSSAPFISPPPVQPFGNTIGFHEFASHLYYVAAAAPTEALRSVPFVAPIPPHPAVFFPAPDPQLHSRIVSQIDYYFSNENLIKDTYLRQNMDDQGWVPIRLIAGFNKVSLLTDNIQLILDAMRSSTVVEVQGDKIRKRNDWMRWIMPSVQFSNLSSPHSQGKSGIDTLASHVQSISLDQKTIDHSRSSSGGSSNRSHLSSSVEQTKYMEKSPKGGFEGQRPYVVDKRRGQSSTQQVPKDRNGIVGLGKHKLKDKNN